MENKIPNFTIIERRAGKSQRKCGELLYRSLIGKSKAWTEEIKALNIHNFTADQYVGGIIDRSYGNPVKIKERFLNIIDDTILFSESIKKLSKKEKRGIESLLLFLNK